MGLGLNLSKETGEGGDRTPIIKFDARAGRVFQVDRHETESGWASNNTDMTMSFIAVFDLARIEVGYIKFGSGEAPDFQMVPLGQPLPARPSKEHRQGFRMRIYSKALGVREFAHTAGVVLTVIDEWHNKYDAAPESKQGLLPVLKLVGSNPIKTSGGGKISTNYQPIFELVQWVPRPAPLAADTRPTASAAPPAAPAAPRAATPVPPPPPVAAAPVAPAAMPAAAALNADDFG